MAYLQRSPEQWTSPEEYIPERFDSTSQYYLAPNGKKRHPMSYGPFLGGRRVCLGKTFAEQIGKCILSIIITQLDFEFVDPKVREIKPPNNFFV